MAVFSFDTETYLIGPGLQAPPVVCLQYAWGDQAPELIHRRDPALRRTWVEALESASPMNGHNVSYDTVCLLAEWPELAPLVFGAYREDRVTCTAVRAKLLDIAAGRYKGYEDPHTGRKYRYGYSLADCTARTVGTLLDKTDPWRLKYGTLINTPLDQWPADAVAYAMGDVTAQQALYHAQEAAGEGLLEDEFRQSRAAFWIHLMETWGVKTDLDQVQRFHAEVLEELEKDREICQASGLVRATGTKDTKAAMLRMVQVMAALEEEPGLTESGEKYQREQLNKTGHVLTPTQVFERTNKYVKLDEDACLEAGDDILLSYQRYGSATTTKKRVERLYMGVVTPLQSRFNSLVETGRTSCTMGDVPKDGSTPPGWGFQFHNLPRKEGMRECCIPRPGCLYVSCDYDGMELKTWAQVCLWAVGQSRLAEVLNAGGDPHADVGATLKHITQEEAAAIMRGEYGPEAKKAFKDAERQSGKIANFGYPGGMGPKTLRRQARAQYRVYMTIPEAYATQTAWKGTWPEAQPYFDWVNSLTGPRHGDGLATIRQFVSGRIRGRIPYTVTCNTFFQGLAADAAKAAGFQIAYECYADPDSPLYGCRIVNFIHDEFILEVPDHPERAHLAAMRLRDIMVGVAQEWVPDVRITAEPALSRRWSKNAEPVYRDGMLIPYEEAA